MDMFHRKMRNFATAKKPKQKKIYASSHQGNLWSTFICLTLTGAVSDESHSNYISIVQCSSNRSLTSGKATKNYMPNSCVLGKIVLTQVKLNVVSFGKSEI